VPELGRVRPATGPPATANSKQQNSKQQQQQQQQQPATLNTLTPSGTQRTQTDATTGPSSITEDESVFFEGGLPRDANASRGSSHQIRNGSRTRWSTCQYWCASASSACPKGQRVQRRRLLLLPLMRAGTERGGPELPEGVTLKQLVPRRASRIVAELALRLLSIFESRRATLFSEDSC